MQLLKKYTFDTKIFLTLVCFTSFVFILSSDGHRFTFDEDLTTQQNSWLLNMSPHPDFVEGESQLFFNFPEYFPNNDRAICLNGILCSSIEIGSSIIQVPFLWLNQNFNFITSETLILTTDDFSDAHYVYWRNSLEPDTTFLELFFGPTFAALSVGVFYLISRSYGLSNSTSVILSIFYGFTTPVWAYSQTSLNIVPAVFFLLLGFLFLRRFLKTPSTVQLILSGVSLGFAFLVRNDMILAIGPIFIFFLFYMIQKSNKIKNSLSLILPLVGSYAIKRTIDYIKTGEYVYTTSDKLITISNTSHTANMFGMLFSPGVGLFVFAPILFTVIVSFVDFFKNYKKESVLFISILIIPLLLYGNSTSWHGLGGWSERYLYFIIPFLLLPLGFSIEKRKNNVFKIILVILGFLGFIINLSYLVTDVSWFIWGIMGSGRGLYALGGVASALWVHPLVIWSFEFSQLTHAIRYLFLSHNPDIYLLNVWGPYFYSIFSIIFVGGFVSILIKLIRTSPNMSLKIK